MKYIYASYAKCGTKSYCQAFRQLGYKVFDWNESMLYHHNEWLEIFNYATSHERIKQLLYNMYKDIEVVTDAPAYLYWQELSEIFPDAKLVFYEREIESWAVSFRGQVESFSKYYVFPDFISKIIAYFFMPEQKKIQEMSNCLLVKVMGGMHIIPRKDFCLNYMLKNCKASFDLHARQSYRRHCADFLRNAPTRNNKKCLILSKKDGTFAKWEPLIKFIENCDSEEVAAFETERKAAFVRRKNGDFEFPHENKKAGVTDIIIAELTVARNKELTRHILAYLIFAVVLIVFNKLHSIVSNKSGHNSMDPGVSLRHSLAGLSPAQRQSVQIQILDLLASQIRTGDDLVRHAKSMEAVQLAETDGSHDSEYSSDEHSEHSHSHDEIEDEHPHDDDDEEEEDDHSTEDEDETDAESELAAFNAAGSYRPDFCPSNISNTNNDPTRLSIARVSQALMFSPMANNKGRTSVSQAFTAQKQKDRKNSLFVLDDIQIYDYGKLSRPSISRQGNMGPNQGIPLLQTETSRLSNVSNGPIGNTPSAVRKPSFAISNNPLKRVASDPDISKIEAANIVLPSIDIRDILNHQSTAIDGLGISPPINLPSFAMLGSELKKATSSTSNIHGGASSVSKNSRRSKKVGSRTSLKSNDSNRRRKRRYNDRKSSTRQSSTKRNSSRRTEELAENQMRMKNSILQGNQPTRNQFQHLMPTPDNAGGGLDVEAQNTDSRKNSEIRKSTASGRWSAFSFVNRGSTMSQRLSQNPNGQFLRTSNIGGRFSNMSRLSSYRNELNHNNNYNNNNSFASRLKNFKLIIIVITCLIICIWPLKLIPENFIFSFIAIKALTAIFLTFLLMLNWKQIMNYSQGAFTFDHDGYGAANQVYPGEPVTQNNSMISLQCPRNDYSTTSIQHVSRSAAVDADQGRKRKKERQKNDHGGQKKPAKKQTTSKKSRRNK